mmetsp:Transcript_2964/g.10580  ORF Transcript_2964/g.10580 Transcript_2964/m.10580 type:complete len:230 (-) Transcript_2964:633-1322(-)
MNTVYRTFTKSAPKKRNVISEETIKFSSTKVQCSSSIRACFSRYYVCCLFFVCLSLFLATMILSLSLSRARILFCESIQYYIPFYAAVNFLFLFIILFISSALIFFFNPSNKALNSFSSTPFASSVSISNCFIKSFSFTLLPSTIVAAISRNARLRFNHVSQCVTNFFSVSFCAFMASLSASFSPPPLSSSFFCCCAINFSFNGFTLFIISSFSFVFFVVSSRISFTEI